MPTPAESALDAVVIGAGPTGLACAIAIKTRGLSVAVLDKGCIVDSLLAYPVNLVFFTTPEGMEIGDLPMTSLGEKPLRVEALKYYRRAAEHYALDVRPYLRVEGVSGSQGDFTVEARDREGASVRIVARTVIAATGFYGEPALLGIPGEELAKVHHYYREPHPFWQRDVLVIGGGNSAVLAALDLLRAGARVTLAHRGASLDECVKYWLRPDFENRAGEGALAAHYSTTVTRIGQHEVSLRGPQGEWTLANDEVLAMTGYRPDFPFLERLGASIDPAAGRPILSGEFETGRPGLFLAGVVVAGVHTGEVFIENGRHHGGVIADAILKRLRT